nr:uncharacterized protein LOC118681282 [Bactrocera oleae]
MKIHAYVLCMFVASVNSGYTLAGSNLNEEIDFGRDNWHGVNQYDEKRSLSAYHKSTDAIGDYGRAFGSGKPITEVMQEEKRSDDHLGVGSQADYGKYTRFIEDGGVLAGKGSAAVSSTGWYGIPGKSSDFSGYSRELKAGKVIHEEVGTGGLGSFRTLQHYVSHQDHVLHGGPDEFSVPQEVKTIKYIRGEDGDDSFGAHRNFNNYEAGGEYTTHFGFDHLGTDHSDQGVKSIHHEDNNGYRNIFKTHYAHGDSTDHNQFGVYGELIEHQAKDNSHGYHAYGGLNFDNTEFEGYENRFGGFKSDGSLSDVA